MRRLLGHPWLTLLMSVTAIAASATAACGEVVVAVDPEFSSINPTGSTTVTVMYDASEATEGIRGYHFEVTFDEGLILIDDPSVDVREGDLLSGVGSTFFFVDQPDSHTVIIDCAILGSTAGASSSGDLCSITFLGRETTPGVSPVHFLDSSLRDPGNGPIEHSTIDGEITLTNSGVTEIEWSSVKALFR